MVKNQSGSRRAVRYKFKYSRFWKENYELKGLISKYLVTVNEQCATWTPILKTSHGCMWKIYWLVTVDFLGVKFLWIHNIKSWLGDSLRGTKRSIFQFLWPSLFKSSTCIPGHGTHLHPTCPSNKSSRLYVLLRGTFCPVQFICSSGGCKWLTGLYRGINILRCFVSILAIHLTFNPLPIYRTD